MTPIWYWKPTALSMEGPDGSGRFYKKLVLDAGSHEYKFVLDGKRWHLDPTSRRQA